MKKTKPYQIPVVDLLKDNPWHHAQLASIDTRFYWFQGAWGAHQAVVVDTQTGFEYELVNRVPNTGVAITEAEIVNLAQRVATHGWEGKRPGFFARQCYHRGLGYNPVAL